MRSTAASYVRPRRRQLSLLNRLRANGLYVTLGNSALRVLRELWDILTDDPGEKLQTETYGRIASVRIDKREV